ncbi:MAG: glycosyltransferase [Phycisphaeraceae bacterium]
MNVALVHEWLTSYAGSEKVLEAVAELYPHAPIHSVIHNPAAMEGTGLAGKEVVTSFLQRMPLSRRKWNLYLPLMPLAIEQFDLNAFDVVLSCNHAVAKGVLTRADQLHISYLCTPIRYAWDLYQPYLQQSGLHRKLRGWLARWLLHRIRQWDVNTANRVDVYACLSHYVARRIWKTYRRKSFVIYPPVDVHRFKAEQKREPFYLTVSRLTPYKKVDLIAAAFTKLDLPLVIIGDGPERKNVERAAGRNVTLLGKQPDAVVNELTQQCRAFIFAADEDFGIAPVEAQAAGAPVIAFGKGGATETIIAGKTGLFFQQQTVESLVEAVQEFERSIDAFNPQACRNNAMQFSEEVFKDAYRNLVEQQWQRFSAGEPLLEP